MTNQNIMLGLALTLILLSGCVAEQPAEQNEDTVATTYSLDDVSGHDSEEDCWMAINGKVYDVTDAIGPHPGGEAILKGCGIDATTMFEGKPHSQNAHDWLDNYYIGELEN